MSQSLVKNRESPWAVLWVPLRGVGRRRNKSGTDDSATQDQLTTAPGRAGRRATFSLGSAVRRGESPS
jgi:hypothetical protein